MSRHNTRLFLKFAAGLALTAALTACGGSKTAPAEKPPQVSVVTLKAQQVPITTTLPGRTVAYRIAQVRPQVSGIILKRNYTEGGDVKAGQQLYQIDPALYRASYDSAKANLMKAKATLTAAELTAERYKPLAKFKAVSQLDLANAEASAQEAKANVAAAKAAVETARINLRYTKVLSPISGRSGRSNVTAGALVTSDQSTALTTVQQLDPVYVDVTQPSAVLLRLEREYADGQLKHAGKQQALVKLILSDGRTYDQTGKLQFSEVTVDPNTGSVTLRAIFPNPKHLLLPGMFVHMRINEGVSQHALLVPQRGVTHNDSGEPTALIVDKDDKVELRTLTTSHAIGDKWLVTAGLEPGDRVIVSGLQFVKPGGKVRVQEEEADSDQHQGDQHQNDADGGSSADKQPATASTTPGG